MRTRRFAALPCLALLLALCDVCAVRAQTTAPARITLAGVGQMEIGDLDGDGANEIVAISGSSNPAYLHVLRRSGGFWLEAVTLEIVAPAAIGQYNTFQLVPSTTTPGALDILYQTSDFSGPTTVYGLGLLANLGGLEFEDYPTFIVGLDALPALPGSIGNFTTAQGSGPKFVTAAIDGGITTSGLYYFSMPLTNAAPFFEPVADVYPLQYAHGDWNQDGQADQLMMGLTPCCGGSFLISGLVRYSEPGGYGSWQLIGGDAGFRDPITVADLDGDGDLDSAFGHGDSPLGPAFSFQSGDGDGLSFVTDGLVDPVLPTHRYRMADVDEDGDLDVITLSSQPSAIPPGADAMGFSVYRNGLVSPGYFGPPVDVMTHPQPTPQASAFSLEVGELTGDGHIDLVISDLTGVTIFSGNGDGMFDVSGVPVRGATIALGADPARVLELFDLDGDGTAELLVGLESVTSSLRRFIHTADFSFTLQSEVDPAPRVDRMVFADLGADGVRDVLTAAFDVANRVIWDAGTQSLQYLGSLTPMDAASGSGEVRGMVTHDFTADGRPDVLFASPGVTGDHLEMHVDNGSGTFVAGPAMNLNGLTGVNGLSLGAYTTGSQPSVLTMSSTQDFAMWLGNLTPSVFGAYAISTGLSVSPPVDSPHPFEVVQFAGSSLPWTMVVPDSAGSRVVLLDETALDSPFFLLRASFATAGAPIAVATGDIDADGDIDFAAACVQPDAITVYHNDGQGDFVRLDIPLGTSGPPVRDVRIGDITGDGDAELVFLRSEIAFLEPGPASRVDGGSPTAGSVSILDLSGVATSGVGPPRPIGRVDPLALSVSPHPMRDVARLSFDLPMAGHVRLELFDASGRRVALLSDGRRAAGRHSLEWRAPSDGGHLPAGLYLARITSPVGVATAKVVRVE